MMEKIKSNLINYSFIFLPLSFISGNLLINLSIIIFSFFFVYELVSKKIDKLYKEKNINFLYVFFIFLAYLIINSILSNEFKIELFFKNILNIRFLIFAFAIKYYITNKTINFKLALKFWLIILAVIQFDILYEFLFGKNLLGFKSVYPGRIASFFGEELIVGTFILGFGVVTFSYFANKNLNFFYTLVLLLFFIFLTGERSNFVKIIFILTLVLLIVDKKIFNFKKFSKFFLAVISIPLIISILLLNSFNYKNLWEKGEKGNVIENNIEDRAKAIFFRYLGGALVTNKKYVSKVDGRVFDDANFYYRSKYGKYYLISKEILINNILFGSGNKSFINECSKYKYILDSKYQLTDPGCTTHPHQIYYELLTEHGLVGTIVILYIIFYLLFKNQSLLILRSNIYKLTLLFYILAFFIPILPSGSFFTTSNAFLFWFAIGIYITENEYI